MHCSRLASCIRPGPPSEPSEARRARRLTSAMHSLKGTMQSNSSSAPLDVNGLANSIVTAPLPTATIILGGGQHHKITHQRDKSSFEILQGDRGAKLEIPADQLHPSSLLLSVCPQVNVREKTQRGRECAIMSHSLSLFALLSHISRGDSERAREPTRHL